MPSLSVSESELLALFTESIAYGIHLVTFLGCISTCFLRSRRSVSKATYWPWVFVAISLFILGSVHVSLLCFHNVLAFIFQHGPDGADAEFERLSSWVYGLQYSCFYLIIAFSDAALIYRCWLIYKFSQWRIIVISVPIGTWFASTTCAAMIIFELLTRQESTTLPRMIYSRPFMTGLLAIQLVQNVMTTGLTVWRLWDIHRQTAPFLAPTQGASGGIGFNVVVVVLIESALIYTLTIIVMSVTYVLQSNVYSCAADVSMQVAGICFDLVLTRIWNGVATEQIQSTARTTHSMHIQYRNNRQPLRRSMPPSLLASSPDPEPMTATSREPMLPWSGGGAVDSPGRLGIGATRNRCVSMPNILTSSDKT
ncbi:uncharacterized protein C8Q71DRAFT_782682 [Rhodofomes roseus]|uniref:Uncharacterized protein n=1 Tax=Rhodofomes roseus TaxID=34475 RepID=A0ABQ8K3R9_9APHY|nr:uncharacterized protein C8Q71DRAFT_782682 [Rhodofomes roseus]KAH9831467.1 hypothetical protein C8Q71DRAFT_782682 [Rhodofomes roseus]